MRSESSNNLPNQVKMYNSNPASFFPAASSSCHRDVFGSQFCQDFSVKRHSKTCALKTPKTDSYVLKCHAFNTLENIRVSLYINKALVDFTVLRLLLHALCL
ncbi:unnamed protein product [Albugo candida]|uniref:Uncharacterized protein n=1 Tax=Albugo candida TaxID=65357 RepID=A0A024FVV8_9STRA|nr:unnamed protein product [Albugo candida]|eukprot:CCI10799.1 unnamed protein product [Albugo candida]